MKFIQVHAETNRAFWINMAKVMAIFPLVEEEGSGCMLMQDNDKGLQVMETIEEIFFMLADTGE